MSNQAPIMVFDPSGGITRNQALEMFLSVFVIKEEMMEAANEDQL